ncbi:hypothetical protein FRB93_002976 [Tulasnella sp. JGI-2019a]|nr:hypothetical protein FRB93_002976 [Tulasnella sp. JGI-2019a]
MSFTLWLRSHPQNDFQACTKVWSQERQGVFRPVHKKLIFPMVRSLAEERPMHSGAKPLGSCAPDQPQT